jgi:hypothetical protein
VFVEKQAAPLTTAPGASPTGPAPAATPAGNVPVCVLPATAVRVLEAAVRVGLSSYSAGSPLKVALLRNHRMPAAGTTGAAPRLSPLEAVGVFAYRLHSRPGVVPQLNKFAYTLAGVLLDLMGLPTGADITRDADVAANRVNLLLRNLADDLERVPVASQKRKGAPGGEPQAHKGRRGEEACDRPGPPVGLQPTSPCRLALGPENIPAFHNELWASDGIPRSLSMSDHMSDFMLFLRGGSSAWGGDAAAQADRDLVLNLLRSVRDPGITG